MLVQLDLPSLLDCLADFLGARQLLELAQVSAAYGEQTERIARERIECYGVDCSPRSKVAAPWKRLLYSVERDLKICRAPGPVHVLGHKICRPPWVGTSCGPQQVPTSWVGK